MKILVTPTSMKPDSPSPALERLKAFADTLVFNPYPRPLAEEELIPLLRGCDGYLAGLDFITKRALESCPQLKAVSRYGAGYDRVDLQAAGELGIVVTNTPGANAEAVGELAFALILSVARRIPYLDAQTKSGAWIRSTGIELNGKTLGIAGLGAIGKVVARCAGGFGMKLAAYDPFINEDYCLKHRIKCCTFEELLACSDVLTLHLPLNEKTYHFVDRDAIRHMKDGAILINASRGGLIDEAAAFDALSSGKISGMGLDAFEEEPPVKLRLLKMDSVVATPHTGAHTGEASAAMADMAVDNLISVLSHTPCPFTLTKVSCL